MINTNATYNSIVSNGGRFEWRLCNTNTAIDASTPTIHDDLIGGTLKRTLYESASIGNVIARQLDFEFYKGITIDTTKPLKLQFRAVGVSLTSLWYDMGEYWVDTIEASKYTDKVKVTAFDALAKANVTYLKTGTWTTKTDLAIANEIATHIGVSLSNSTISQFLVTTNINQAPNIGTNGTSEMQMLSYIGVMKGGNWIINDDNKLELIPLFAEQSVGHDAVNLGNAVTDFDASDAEQITGICLWANDNTYYRYPDVTDSAWEALGGRKINADLHIMASQALAQSLYTSLGGKYYYPYSAPKAWLDPKYQLGDKITIKNVTSVICNQTINLDALAASELVAEGLKQVKSSFPTLTPQERQMAQNEENIAKIEIKTGEIESTVRDSVNNLQTQITQNASGISILTQYQSDQESYLEYDGTIPALKIGIAGSSVHSEITDDSFKIIDGVQESTFRDGALTTNIVRAESETQTGKYAWVDEDIDGFSLLYMVD